MFRLPLSGWPQAVLHSGELSAALIPPLLPARLFIAAPAAALLIRIEPENRKENKLCEISTMTIGIFIYSKRIRFLLLLLNTEQFMSSDPKPKLFSGQKTGKNFIDQIILSLLNAWQS
jgi:hypothetical protein